MAKERELIVMETGHRMFSTCGMLYKAGLGGGAVWMENAIVLQYHVSADDFTPAGEAESDVKGKLKSSLASARRLYARWPLPCMRARLIW